MKGPMLMFLLALGAAAGYQLPAFVSWLRGFVRRRTFRPVLLTPWRPAPRQEP